MVLPDGLGFVELLGTFGDDLTVVNAARVSLEKESHELTPQDVRLIHYLAKHEHLSPFFHPQVRFRIKMPIFVAREWMRHTVGFARNEVSRRYVHSEPHCWVPEQVREASASIKQGSKQEEIAGADEVHRQIAEHITQSCALYNELISNQVAPEIARAVLPQSMYTEFIETASLYGYIRLIQLRTSPDAQAEIRQYANMVASFIRQQFPHSYDAFI